MLTDPPLLNGLPLRSTQVRMASSSSCTFTATLRPSLTPPPSLRRSPPTSQSVLPKPLARSLRLHTASRIGVNPNKFECRSSPPEMFVIRTEKAKGKVRLLDSEDSLAVSLAKYTADLSDKFAKERGAFTVVLSGGSLIKSLRKLVEAPYIDTVDWSKWHVFWVDERVVPKDHEDSNYKLAYDGFLSKVPIPPGNVHAINDELSAEGAADDYETCLKHLVKTNIIDISQATGLPKFDLMLLGMGPDGHVASLFPGHPLVQEKKRWVAFIKDSPKPPPERITFTFPVINSSANIALVVAGAGKANVVNVALGGDDLSADLREARMIMETADLREARMIMETGKANVEVNVTPSSDLLPVEMVSPEGELTWFLDTGAASELLTKSYWMFA